MNTDRPAPEKVLEGLIRRDSQIEGRFYSANANDPWSIFGNILAAYSEKNAFNNPLMRYYGYDDPRDFIGLIYSKLTPEVLRGVKENIYSYTNSIIRKTVTALTDPNRHKKLMAILRNMSYFADPLPGKNNKVVEDIISDTIIEYEGKSAEECDAILEYCMQAAGLNPTQKEVFTANYEKEPVTDAAKRLGISRACFDTNLCRARRPVGYFYKQML